MKHLRVFLAISFMLQAFILKTQNLAGFSDYKNYFFTFDKGQTTQAEYLPVQSFQVGGNSIAYIDNTNSLKIFYNGKITTVSDGIITKYTATDYLVSYSLMQMLNVFDGGRIIPLNSFADSYSTGDSLVSFYDSRRNAFNMYYRGNIITLEELMQEPPLKSFKMGDNIFACVNYLDQFKLFYRGNYFKIMSINRSLPYEAGKNIVAYCNDKYGFSVFYKGLIYDLETFQPKSFAAGDDMMAYVTTNEQLNVFYAGKTQVLSDFEPDFYKVEDSLVVYNQAKKFKAFYKGNSYTLEEYIPDNYLIDFNTIAYLDLQGRLKTFCGGESKLITNSKVDDFKLYRNVIWYKVFNQNYIYYQSKSYPQ